MVSTRRGSRLLSQIGTLEPRDDKGGGAGGRGAGKAPKRRGRKYLGAWGSGFATSRQRAAPEEPARTSWPWSWSTPRGCGRARSPRIRPSWAERLGGDLVKRTNRAALAAEARPRRRTSGPPCTASRWSRTGWSRSGRSMPSCPASCSSAMPWCREWDGRHRFLATNRRLLEEAEELEHRARRRGIVVDEETLFDFYDARVGAGVVSGAHFDQWWKRERRERPELPTFDPAMLTHDHADQVREADFPQRWQGSAEGLTFPIRYHFEPGSADDGLTIDVPVATLNQVADDDFSWNVPGLRAELVTSLIRSLPKNLRVSLVPAPDKAREFLAAVPPGRSRCSTPSSGGCAPASASWCRARPGTSPGRRAPAPDLSRAGRGRP